MTPDIRPDLPPNMSVSRVTFRDRSKIVRVGNRWFIVLPNGDIMRPACHTPDLAIRWLESWWRLRAAEQVVTENSSPPRRNMSVDVVECKADDCGGNGHP